MSDDFLFTWSVAVSSILTEDWQTSVQRRSHMGCLSNLLEKLAFESSSVKWAEQLGFRLLCKWKLRQIARQLESLIKLRVYHWSPSGLV